MMSEGDSSKVGQMLSDANKDLWSFSLFYLSFLTMLAFFLSLLHGCKMAATAPNIMSHNTAFRSKRRE